MAAAEEADRNQLNMELQTALNAVVQQNSLVYAAILINRNGVVFAPYSTMVSGTQLSMSLGCDESAFHGMSLLP